MNTHLGMKRYLGMAKSSGNLEKFRQTVILTIGFVSLTILISALLVALPNLQLLEIVGIDRQYVWIVIALIPAMAFNNILPEVLIAAHQSRNLATALLIGSILRFPVLFGTLYVLNTPPTIGTTIAYSSALFITPILCSVYLSKVLPWRMLAINNVKNSLRNILGASLASWVPSIVSVLGSQLGILTVYSVEGAAEAGKFYLPLTIFTITLFIVNGINRVSLL